MNSRGDHGFFTLGVSPEAYVLPHPRIPLAIIRIVQRVIIRAFAILRERCYPLDTTTEDEITIALLGIIENDLRQSGSVPGFNCRTFDSVTRQSQVENYNFTKLKTAPDLCFRLRGNQEPTAVLSTHHALFVECKPVDRSHPAGKMYCAEGLRRFVGGDYAWAMQDALMLGYARHGRNLRTHLIPAMKKRRVELKTEELPLPLPHPDEDRIPHAEPLYRSRHSRGFAWPHGKGSAVDIFIYHVWHRCD